MRHKSQLGGAKEKNCIGPVNNVCQCQDFPPKWFYKICALKDIFEYLTVLVDLLYSTRNVAVLMIHNASQIKKTE